MSDMGCFLEKSQRILLYFGRVQRGVLFFFSACTLIFHIWNKFLFSYATKTGKGFFKA